METWPRPSTDPYQQVMDFHVSHTGRTDAAVATAPSSIAILGAPSERAGGSVVMALGAHTCAVAITPSEDPNLRCACRRVTGTGTTTDEEDSLSFSDMQAVTSAAISGTPVDTELYNAHPLAGRCAAILGAVINRQLYPRQHGGVTVSIWTDIPPISGLGGTAACDVATALAFATVAQQADDIATRAQLAEALIAVATTISPEPLLASHYHACLRGEGLQAGAPFAVITPQLGAVTSLRRPALPDRTALDIHAVWSNHMSTDAERIALAHRYLFLDELYATYGISSIEELPDAAARTVRWLTAVESYYRDHSDKKPVYLPTPEDGARLVTELYDDYTLTSQAVTKLRSSGPQAFFAAIDASTHSLNAAPQGVEELPGHVYAARAVFPGLSPVTVALTIPQKHAGADSTAPNDHSDTRATVAQRRTRADTRMYSLILGCGDPARRSSAIPGSR